MKELDSLSTNNKKILGSLFASFSEVLDLSTIQWAETRRHLSKDESFYSGKFDCDRIPALEYIYDCLDNWGIYIVVVMKASQVGWSELSNNYYGRRIEVEPGKTQIVFPNRDASRIYSREKLKPFFDNCEVLKDLISQSKGREAYNYFKFPGGFIKLTTAGSISNAKTSSIPVIAVEEPDDVKDDVANQGDTLENYKRRQVTFPIGHKKLLYGGTPTDKDFSRVSNGYDASNKMIFKAQCHHCKELVPLSTTNIVYAEFPDRFIHEDFGQYNPESAKYLCPSCGGEWTDEDRDTNIRNGKKFGFYDHTGRFSKGWHTTRPEVTEAFGFHIPELLSTLSATTHIEVAKKMIIVKKDLDKGNEGIAKSFTNNVDGLPYASGTTSMEVEDMRKLRKNYPEGVVPMEGLVLTAGVDVQDNRFAIVIRAWGRRENSWLVLWKEIYGRVVSQEWDEMNLEYKGVWGELTDLLINNPIQHASGQTMYVHAISIDSGDNTESVYNWVNYANARLEQLGRAPHAFATKGTRDLKYSSDDIYQEPTMYEVQNARQARKSLYQTKGINLFMLGAHRAHDEILLRIKRNAMEDCNSGIYYFNKQSYGLYEEQMLSCRKIVESATTSGKAVYKLIPGKRKEAMDSEKNALHAMKAVGIHLYGNDIWKELERYYYV